MPIHSLTINFSAQPSGWQRMRAVVEPHEDHRLIQFLLKPGANRKIIAIDDISIAAGHCDDIDEAFPPDYGPSVCSVDDGSVDGKI